MREFRTGKTTIIASRIMPWLFLVPVAVSVSLLFPAVNCSDTQPPWILAVGGMLLFGGLFIYFWRESGKLSNIGIGVDEDGIWHLHTGKDGGLVRWEDISELRHAGDENSFYLQDLNGKKLIVISGFLAGISDLEVLINEKII